MPDISTTNDPSLGYISATLFFIGLFLFVSGLNIVKIEKFSVTHGFKSWFAGLFLMLVGLIVAIPKILPYEPSISSFFERLTREEKFIGIDKKLVAKAKAGDVKSQSELARVLWVNNKDESFIWDMKAAQQGSLSSYWRLGSQYKNGFSPEKNYKESVYWYEKAYKQTTEKPQLAKILIGMYSTGGAGLEKNLLKAYQWALKYNDVSLTPDDSDEILSSLADKLYKDNSYSLGSNWKRSLTNGVKSFQTMDKNFYFSSPDSFLVGTLNDNLESNRYGGIFKYFDISEELIGENFRFSGKISNSGYEFTIISIQALGEVKNGKADKYKHFKVNIKNTKEKWEGFDLIMEIPSYTKHLGVTIYSYGKRKGFLWVDNIKAEKADKRLEEKYGYITTHNK